MGGRRERKRDRETERQRETICPIIRYLTETNNDLQKRIDKALKNIEDLRMEKWSIIGSEIIDE